MIFDDVISTEPIINEYFCRARHENCDMIYLKQNILSADRQNVREYCNLFIFFEQTGKAITAIYFDQLTGSQLSYNDFSNICERFGPDFIITLSLMNLKIDMIVVN